MQSITIDRNKHLKDEPHLGHNRWHPDIPPVLEVAPGEEAVLETRDSADGRVRFGMTPAELGPHGKWVHPLTGPLYVQGAVPGDLLEVEYLDIQPQPYGWTRCGPTGGLLRDLFQETYVAHWELQDGWATSPQIPGVRIPNGAFMGTAGVAPSHSQLTEWAQREAAFAARGGVSFPPDAAEAVPDTDPIAGQGLRTIPPRENGGNLDVKQLTMGVSASPPGERARGALFRGRRPLCPRRWRVLPHCHRDGSNGSGALPHSPGRSGATPHPLAAYCSPRLLSAAGVWLRRATASQQWECPCNQTERNRGKTT